VRRPTLPADVRTAFIAPQMGPAPVVSLPEGRGTGVGPGGADILVEMTAHTESRRSFLKKLGWAAAGVVVGGTGLDVAYEKTWVEVSAPRIAIRGLPPQFEGFRLCQITDVHHGPYLSLDRVYELMRLALRQAPDVFVITGDMSHRAPKYVPPVWEALGQLAAPMGVWCVMGNHDHWHGIEASRRGAERSGIVELRNRAAPLVRGDARIWLAGVGDLWEDEPDAQAALRGIPADEPVVLLTHNPDYADEVHDPRVKLMLAGHSHGGQVSLPLLGPIAVPCKRKYTRGLVPTDVSQVYICRGLGMATVPFRMGSRPELAVIELTRA